MSATNPECGATRGEMLCGLDSGHPPPHRDGNGEWRDSDPLPRRTKDHVIGAGGYCTRCRARNCLADIEIDDEDLP